VLRAGNSPSKEGSNFSPLNLSWRAAFALKDSEEREKSGIIRTDNGLFWGNMTGLAACLQVEWRRITVAGLLRIQ